MSTNQPQQPTPGNQVAPITDPNAFISDFRTRNKALRDREEALRQEEEDTAETQQALIALAAQQQDFLDQKRKQLEKDREAHAKQFKIVQPTPTAPTPAPDPTNPSTSTQPAPASDPRFEKLERELDLDVMTGKERKELTLLALAGFDVKDKDPKKIYEQLDVAPGTTLTHKVLRDAVNRKQNPSAPAAGNASSGKLLDRVSTWAKSQREKNTGDTPKHV